MNNQMELEDMFADNDAGEIEVVPIYSRADEQADLANAAYYDEIAQTTGTHPPNCCCGWCEPPEGFVDQWLI